MDTISSKQLIVLWVPCCLFGLYQLYRARSGFTRQRQQGHTSFLNVTTDCSNQLPGTTALWGKGSTMWGRTENPTHFSNERCLKWGALSNTSVCTKLREWESWQCSSRRPGRDLKKLPSRLLNRGMLVSLSNLRLAKSLVHSGWTEREKYLFIPIA